MRRRVLNEMRSSITGAWERGGGNDMASAVGEGQSVPRSLSERELEVLNADLNEIERALGADDDTLIPRERLLELARTYTTVIPVEVSVPADPRSPYPYDVVDDFDAFELGTRIGRTSDWTVNTLDGRRLASRGQQW